MATDYDSWRPHSAAVTVTDVLKTLHANADTARLIAASVLEDLVSAVVGTGEGAHPNGILASEAGSMRYSIMPRSKAQKHEDRKKLAYILPEYFADEEGEPMEKI
jgi:5'-methylthioadenosine phosphorylase